MKKILSALALAACALTANAALVATGDLTLNGYEYAGPPTGDTAVWNSPVVHFGIGSFDSPDHTTNNLRLGSLSANYTVTNVIGATPLTVGDNLALILFCIDLTENSGAFGFGNPYQLNVPATQGLSAFSGSQSLRLGKLFERAFFSQLGTNAPFGDATDSAALQLAIWEVVYDSGSTFGNVNDGDSIWWDDGQFRVSDLSSGVRNAANALLSGLDLDPAAGGAVVSFNNFGNKGGLQDFVTYVPTGTFGCNEDNCGGTVPEPGSLALAASAMLGLGVFGRRRKLKVVSE